MGPEKSRHNFFLIFQFSPFLPKPQLHTLVYTHLARGLVFFREGDGVRTQKWTLSNKGSNTMRKSAILQPGIRCVYAFHKHAVCFLLFFYCLNLHYSRILLIQLFIKWSHEISVLLSCWSQWAAAIQYPFASKQLKAHGARLAIEVVRQLPQVDTF